MYDAELRQLLRNKQHYRINQSQNLLTKLYNMLYYQCGESSPYYIKEKTSQITQDKIFRTVMNISDIATVRTGLVKARKEKSSSSGQVYDYNLLNLKCISNDGDIIRDHLEPYTTSDELKEDYLTHLGDVLVFQRSCFFLISIILSIFLKSKFPNLPRQRNLEPPLYS